MQKTFGKVKNNSFNVSRHKINRTFMWFSLCDVDRKNTKKSCK